MSRSYILPRACALTVVALLGVASLAAVARLTALAPAIPAHAAAAGDPAAAPIDIPDNTWVARKLPERGKGSLGGKHVRIVPHPPSGRLYFLGGDWSGPGGPESGRNEVYSYSIKGDDWRLEWPYCGPADALQPSHPDQVGWVWDSTRSQFWMIPGYMGVDEGRCRQAGSILKRFEIMTFDPATRTWAWPKAPLPFQTPGNQKFAQYDPKTDTIILFFYQSRVGVGIYDIKKNAWSQKRFSHDAKLLGKEYTALDLERRVIYIIEPVEARLYRYDIDGQDLTVVGDVPRGSANDTAMPIWDSVNRVLFFPQYFTSSEITFHVYHPDTKRWDEPVRPSTADGLRVRGTNGVFDPVQNVLLITGQRGNETDFNRHIFLYRYRKAASAR